MIPGIRLFLSLSLLMMLASCDKKDEPRDDASGIAADSLIAESKMICIMADVHIIEAALLLDRNEGIVSKERTAGLYAGLFNKYRISRSRYEDNLRHYSQDPELFAKMYGKVILQLEGQQKRFIPAN